MSHLSDRLASVIRSGANSNLFYSALRIVTGCHLKTPKQQHCGTKMLTVKQNGTLLNRQFLRKTKDSIHPNNVSLTRPANSRSKAIIMDITWENSAISHLAQTDLKKSLQIIHQTVAQDAIESYKCCLVLGGRPPPVDKSEKQLPRPTRCTLSQPKLWMHVLTVGPVRT